MEKVLVIDDSLVQAEYLKLILQDEYDVTVCQTGADGFLQAMSGEYSLIFLDVVMPDIDGFMLLRKLQGTVQTKYTPVILITSLSDVQHEEKGLTLGAVDYISKPFSFELLCIRIKKLIEQQENRKMLICLSIIPIMSLYRVILKIYKHVWMLVKEWIMYFIRRHGGLFREVLRCPFIIVRIT